MNEHDLAAEQLKNVIADHLLWTKGECGKLANLSGANLSRVNLYGVNLSRANLSRVNLSGANLSGANLSGANLSRVNLSGANLSGANLSGADLSGANLSRVDLSGANLSRADLSRVNGLLFAQCSFSNHGECGRMLTAVRIGNEDHYFCGCFKGTAAELNQYIMNGEERYKNTRLAAFRFVFEQMAAMEAA
jgi:uncharacterized protein YjbI with pentapeptide repeats